MTRRRLPALAARAYHKNIVDHYEKPRNVGSLDKADPTVGTGLVGAPACGDVMKLQMRVAPDGTVEEAVFKVCNPSAAQPRTLSAASRIRFAQPHGIFSRTADVWVRLCHRELLVYDRVAQRQDARRGRHYKEFGHRQAPEAAASQAALLHVSLGPALEPPTGACSPTTQCRPQLATAEQSSHSPHSMRPRRPHPSAHLPAPTSHPCPAQPRLCSQSSTPLPTRRLAEDAVKAAIKDYQAKQAAVAPPEAAEATA